MPREGYEIPAQMLADNPESIFAALFDADAHIMAFARLANNHDPSLHDLFSDTDLAELFNVLDTLAMHAQYVRAWIAS